MASRNEMDGSYMEESKQECSSKIEFCLTEWDYENGILIVAGEIHLFSQCKVGCSCVL